ncbi:MAG TPA: hypothetical protein PKA76_02515 [Pirellulaceae bacterium]|nr:hypothetical protein [Pirellulaceae bacterium]
MPSEITFEMQLTGYSVECPSAHDREQVVRDFMTRQDPPLLVLNTCQRLECYGFGLPEDPRIVIRETFNASHAFERIARIVAGLESRVLGELEVLGQARTAYKVFHRLAHGRHNRLDRMFQDAFALGRNARKISGIDSNLISLSGIATRALIEAIPENGSVAVVGAGSLAGSVVRNLRKRGNYPVRIASRCPDNALALAVEVGGFSAALDDLAHLFKHVHGIITATAAPHALVFPHHLEHTHRPLTLIDLGVPADCDSAVRTLPGVTYISLEDIEARAHVNTEDRRQRAEHAARFIREGALAWAEKN